MFALSGTINNTKQSQTLVLLFINVLLKQNQNLKRVNFVRATCFECRFTASKMSSKHTYFFYTSAVPISILLLDVFGLAITTSINLQQRDETASIPILSKTKVIVLFR